MCGRTSVAGVAAELPLPNVKVEGVGQLIFPLLPHQAEKIVQAAKPASCGRTETRATPVWQVSPDHVDIEPASSWQIGFEDLLHRAVDGLGIDSAFVEAKLYKLLLFQKGGRFDCHRETDRQRGQFATLVVQLPSDFSGGEFVVRHDEIEESHALGSDDSSCSQFVHFVAHYADCEYAIREVTGGHRLALVYSLCWIGEGDSPTSAALSSTALSKRLAVMFEDIFNSNDAPIPLCVHLERQYAEWSLRQHGIRTLEGRDRGVADTILATSNLLAQKDRGNELSMCITSCSPVSTDNGEQRNCSTCDDGCCDAEMDDNPRMTLNAVFALNGEVIEDLEDLQVDWIGRGLSIFGEENERNCRGEEDGDKESGKSECSHGEDIYPLQHIASNSGQDELTRTSE